MSRGSKRYYDAARLVLRPIFRAAYRCSVEGAGNVPASGPVVLVANHTSYLDPVVVGLACPRRVHFMAKAELFDIPVLGRIIRRLGAFPVRRRGSDARALKEALARLRSGLVVGIFPEGTRNRGGLGEQAFPGAVALAQKVGAALVPVGISGTDGVLPGRGLVPRFPRVTVRIGRPLRLEETADRVAATGTVMERVRELAGGQP